MRSMAVAQAPIFVIEEAFGKLLHNSENYLDRILLLVSNSICKIVNASYNAARGFSVAAIFCLRHYRHIRSSFLSIIIKPLYYCFSLFPMICASADQSPHEESLLQMISLCLATPDTSSWRSTKPQNMKLLLRAVCALPLTESMQRQAEG